MKLFSKLSVALCVISALIPIQPMAQAQTAFSEPWKGHTLSSPLEMGILAGGNIYGRDVFWSVLVSAAYLVNEDGWAADIDDRIWVELQAGPSFFSVPGTQQTGAQYSAHLRWDFTYNEFWTFYGLGGLSGFALPSSFGGGLTMHPRFGVGFEYQTKVELMFRGEVSAEFFGAGIAFNF